MNAVGAPMTVGRQLDQGALVLGELVGEMVTEHLVVDGEHVEGLAL